MRPAEDKERIMRHLNEVVVLVVAGLSLLGGPPTARAHCDTMDGPVIKDAQAALASRDVTPVLKWVAPELEATIRQSFERAVAVRALGPEARDLADRFFFETLVRIHREGEGAPYTGLKEAGAPVDPAIVAADRALETGSVEGLGRLLTAKTEQGLRERFARVAEARRNAAKSVERGREYVAAYVEFTHYAERLHADAVTSAHGAQEKASAPPHRH
jgi:hypothetical protein